MTCFGNRKTKDTTDWSTGWEFYTGNTRLQYKSDIYDTRDPNKKRAVLGKFFRSFSSKKGSPKHGPKFGTWKLPSSRSEKMHVTLSSKSLCSDGTGENTLSDGDIPGSCAQGFAAEPHAVKKSYEAFGCFITPSSDTPAFSQGSGHTKTNEAGVCRGNCGNIMCSLSPISLDDNFGYHHISKGEETDDCSAKHGNDCQEDTLRRRTKSEGSCSSTYRSRDCNRKKSCKSDHSSDDDSTKESILNGHDSEIKGTQIKYSSNFNDAYCCTSEEDTQGDTRPVLGKARALVDCTPSPYDKDGLSFKKGDVIDILAKSSSGYWVGRLRNHIGHFKFINVEEILDSERKSQRHSAEFSTHINGSLKTLEDLLRHLELEVYLNVLVLNGFHNLESLKDLDEDDLTDLGILKVDHQQRILSAIDQLNEVHSEEYTDIASQDLGDSSESFSDSKFKPEKDLVQRHHSQSKDPYNIGKSVVLGSPLMQNGGCPSDNYYKSKEATHINFQRRDDHLVQFGLEPFKNYTNHINKACDSEYLRAINNLDMIVGFKETKQNSSKHAQKSHTTSDGFDMNIPSRQMNTELHESSNYQSLSPAKKCFETFQQHKFHEKGVNKVDTDGVSGIQTCLYGSTRGSYVYNSYDVSPGSNGNGSMQLNYDWKMYSSSPKNTRDFPSQCRPTYERAGKNNADGRTSLNMTNDYGYYFPSERMTKLDFNSSQAYHQSMNEYFMNLSLEEISPFPLSNHNSMLHGETVKKSALPATSGSSAVNQGKSATLPRDCKIESTDESLPSVSSESYAVRREKRHWKKLRKRKSNMQPLLPDVTLSHTLLDKVSKKLKEEHIDLSMDPYTDKTGFCGIPPALVQRYADELQEDIVDVAEALDQNRVNTLKMKGRLAVPNDFLADSCCEPVVEANYSDLSSWLISLGLPIYERALQRAGFSDLHQIIKLKDPDLHKCGVENPKHMRLLKTAIEALHIHFEHCQYVS